MVQPENARFAARLKASGLSQDELAERLNAHIEDLTGRPGSITSRHIRNWLTGKTRWPQERQRIALQAEFGSDAYELGFMPRNSAGSKVLPAGALANADPEDILKRRHFTVVGAAALGGAALPSPVAAAGPLPRIGMAQVDALEGEFDQLVLDEAASGATARLEAQALAFSEQALTLQTSGGMLPERVRSRIYSLASSFAGFAVWAAVDRCRPERAHRYVGRALTLARLSGRAEAELRVWRNVSILAGQRGDDNEAMAAAQMARDSSACRRDPLLASITSVRLASVSAGAGNALAGRRALDRAHTAFQQADHAAQRDSWWVFYDAAELHGLSALTLMKLGEHEEAEAHLHRTLALLRPEYRRNRAYYTAHLALTQLRQGDAETACGTALTVISDPTALTGRTRTTLRQFDHGLTRVAPGARFASEWTDRFQIRKGHP
ncbi:XRE family transcriptional regulator [Streptomyces sp. NPDC094448]|uniref:XRE family transcriptional regulator n=1 Tax=Streptomyces sp. NPDC094448 TaxID=3366063 RepID=UPI003819D836